MTPYTRAEQPEDDGHSADGASSGASTAPLTEPSLLEVLEKLRAESAKPTVELNSQDWAGMDGVIAWHLIDRHADNWADIGQMMNEWLTANVGGVEAQPATTRRITPAVVSPAPAPDLAALLDECRDFIESVHAGEWACPFDRDALVARIDAVRKEKP